MSSAEQPTGEGLARRFAESCRPIARIVANTLVPRRRRVTAQWRRINRAFADSPMVVRTGPFSGMLLGQITTGSHYPKILGTYEQELHESIEELVQRSYETIVDVGCGEGFYAVGLARRIPSATVHGFDVNPDAQRACRNAAAANGVGDRVQTAGLCSHVELTRLGSSGGRTLVLTDCEGCEASLLDPIEVPSLTSADLLVETHEFAVPGVTTLLLNRFSRTHVIRTVRVSAREVDHLDIPGRLSLADEQRVVDESRPPDQVWLVMLAVSDV